MRLFIASRATVKNYGQICSGLSGSIYAKWVEENNLHLTWVFLGESMSKEEAVERVSQVSTENKPTILKGLGYFGRPPRVLYIGREAKSFKAEIKSFEEAGFDMKRFKAHITLCRIKEIEDRDKFYNFVKKEGRDFEAVVDSEVILYSSRLTPKGAVYTKLWSNAK